MHAMAKKKRGILHTELSQGTLYALLIGCAVLLVCALFARMLTDRAFTSVQSELLGLSVRKPYLIAQGHGLGRVTLIARNGRAERELGEATLVATDPWNMQQWQMLIPEEPLEADSIIARAYAKGDVIGEAELAYKGTQALSDALWNDHLADDVSEWRREIIADTNVSVRLPQNVGTVSNGSPLSGTADLGLAVDIVDLTTDVTPGSAYAEVLTIAQAEASAMRQRLFGPQGDAYLPSAQIITVDGRPAKSYVMLDSGGTCPHLGRALVLADGRIVVYLTLGSPDLVDILTAQRPAYFVTEDIRCGTAWKDEESRRLFYQELLDGTAPRKLQLWFDMYDKLLEGVEIGA